jgi:hypothetical protein
MSRSRTLRDQHRARRQIVRAKLAPKHLSAPLTDAWKHARWMFLQICAFFDTPRAIAAQTYMLRATHAECNDLIHHLELITRRIILIAALALDIILAPLKPNTRERKKRRVLVWPHRPETWRTSFRMLNARGQVSDRAPPLQVGLTDPSQLSRFLGTLPLARRFEAVRRVLTNPDRLVRRTALRLARLQARATADAPFLIRFRKLKLQPGPHVTRGLRMIVPALEILTPLADDALARWNEAADPG